jgi:CubicO group peptidase (beta-lactamase class C family)
LRAQARSLFIAVFLGLIFCSSIQAQTAPPPDLDSYVASALKTFDVPGLSIAIVKDGKTVLAKGYGFRKLGAPSR